MFDYGLDFAAELVKLHARMLVDLGCWVAFSPLQVQMRLVLQELTHLPVDHAALQIRTPSR